MRCSGDNEFRGSDTGVFACTIKYKTFYELTINFLDSNFTSFEK